MTTGQRIKEARKRAGVTQVELGALLGVSGSMIAQYETDKRNPKKETIQRIADALNVSAASLNGWDSAQDRLNSAGLSIDDIAYEMNIPIEESLKKLTGTLERMRQCLLPLNEEGQQKVIEHAEAYAKDLAEIPRYRAEPAPQVPAEAALDQDAPAAQDAPAGDEKPDAQKRAIVNRPDSG